MTSKKDYLNKNKKYILTYKFLKILILSWFTTLIKSQNENQKIKDQTIINFVILFLNRNVFVRSFELPQPVYTCYENIMFMR